MPKKTSDWFAAIGSIGTALAAAIALVALLVALQSDEAGRRREDAAEVRRNLMLIAQESELLSRLLSDGSPIILGSAHIADEFQNRLGPERSVDDFWAQFDRGKPTMLSIAFKGWHRSELSLRIDELRTSLRRLRIVLTGDLSLLRYPVELYDGIIDDAYSPMIFIRLLSDEKNLLLQSSRDEMSVSRVTSDLAAELQGNASLYYVARYQTAVAAIDEFIQLAGRSFVDLEDGQLLGLSREAVGSTNPSRTRTESMRHHLERIRHRVPYSTHKQLEELTDRIEQSISKEQAREAIKEYSGDLK